MIRVILSNRWRGLWLGRLATFFHDEEQSWEDRRRSSFRLAVSQLAEDGVETSRREGGVDNEIRLRTELEGCDRMIVERYKALGNKAATISPGNIPQDYSACYSDKGAPVFSSGKRNEIPGQLEQTRRNNVDRQRRAAYCGNCIGLGRNSLGSYRDPDEWMACLLKFWQS